MELRPSQLQQEWRSGRFRPVYYLFGEEQSPAKAAAVAELKALLKPDAFNLAEFTGEIESQTAAIVSEALTIPAFADRRLVIVHSPKLLAGARAAFADYLKNPMPSTTLVLLSDDAKPDQRDALYKAASAAGAACAFGPMREEEAVERLQAEARRAGKTLSGEAAGLLVAEAGADWGVLSQELDKALLFAGARKELSREDVLSCLGYRRSADPYALPRLVQARDLKASLAQLRRLLQEPKPEEFKILGQISRAVSTQLKAKLMLRAGKTEGELFGPLRIHPHYDRDFPGIVKRFSEARLRRDLKRCLRTEVDLKSKTWLDPKVELELLVVDLCPKP